MDVERIQKINNLALDLMKQGLATSRDDAIAQAEKIFRSQDTEDYNEMRERMEESKPQQQTTQVELSKEKIEVILQKNTQFLVKTIKEFQDKISTLENDLNLVKKQMLNLQRQPQAAPKIEPANPQKELPQAEPKTSNHPRSGNYNDDDVSVEKFFYMGSR